MGQLSEMLSEVVLKPGVKCQLSLGLSATPLHDFSKAMLVLQGDSDKMPQEPRVGTDACNLLRKLWKCHNSRLAYPESFIGRGFRWIGKTVLSPKDCQPSLQESI